MRRTVMIKNIDTALRIYYTYPELTSKEINELFGKLAPSTITRYKSIVKTEQRKREVRTNMSNSINTQVAYDVWGIDVNDLEKRRSKLIKLGLQA